ncbi:MAG: (cytosine-5-)-methyltransferase [Verrucomicrobiales bacterium]|nr:(cytosine-5-)-methyltransferase [Verrucomicrobiales bacterium]
MSTFYEFFAGGGMARAGLGGGWQCTFANDFDAAKAAIYRKNWGDDHLVEGDIAKVTTRQLPGEVDLAWASFPCQDLSLAGCYRGLEGERSGTFWTFWQLMLGLRRENRAPKIITIENVYGILTSNDSLDFRAIATACAEAGYTVGAMIVDACYFLPHSRPRFFLIGVRNDLTIPDRLKSESPHFVWHPARLLEAYSKLSNNVKDRWIWWNLPEPEPNIPTLVSMIEETPTLVAWHTSEETRRLLAMMSERNAAKVRAAQALPGKTVGTLYKRMRKDEKGAKVQRAEVRFDKIAGCLRTPAGGSSRQTIMVVNGQHVRSRLLSPREAVRLMGLPDTYQLPEKYNDGYKLAGDGVVVPIVSHLRRHLFGPIVRANERVLRQAV